MIEIDYDAGYFRARRSVYLALRGDVPTLQVWLEIEHRARYSAPGAALGASGRIVNLQLGQAVLGRRDLAETLGLGEQQVRTSLKKLEKLAIIRTDEVTNLGTTVTLVGFTGIAETQPATQPAQQPANQPTSNPRPSRGQPLTRQRDRDPDGEFFSGSADPEPPLDGGRDLVQRKGPLSEPVTVGDGARATENLQKLLRGEAPNLPGLRLLEGGGGS